MKGLLTSCGKVKKIAARAINLAVGVAQMDRFERAGGRKEREERY
jgi:hypothetical protein